jgi:hypothetical protein
MASVQNSVVPVLLTTGTQEDPRALKQHIVMTNAAQKVMMGGGGFNARRASDLFRGPETPAGGVPRSLNSSLAMTLQHEERFEERERLMAERRGSMGKSSGGGNIEALLKIEN